MVNHDQQILADVLVHGELIEAIGPNLKVCVSLALPGCSRAHMGIWHITLHALVQYNHPHSTHVGPDP